MSTLISSYCSIGSEIESACLSAGRAPGSIQLLAVSKGQPAAAIATLYAAGQRHFGENHLSEAHLKQKQLPYPDLVWHYLGVIQSNKAASIAHTFDVVHTLCRAKEAQGLNRACASKQGPLKVYIQVRLSPEPQKNGVEPEALEDLTTFVLQECPYLSLQGLMCLPPLSRRLEEQYIYVDRLSSLLKNLKTRHGAQAPLDQLSMGMSHDFKAAITKGSTCVRIGQGLFGPRGV